MERFDFDTVINRKNTACLKYDFAGEYGVPEDTLPFWIADMDFKVADCITDALRDRVEHGIYGYSTQAFLISGRSPAGRKTFQLGYPPGMAHKTPGVVPPSTSP
ncbi:MAG: hypothetical protein ACLRZN_01815 [Dialister invisus]